MITYCLVQALLSGHFTLSEATHINVAPPSNDKRFLQAAKWSIVTTEVIQGRWPVIAF